MKHATHWVFPPSYFQRDEWTHSVSTFCPQLASGPFLRAEGIPGDAGAVSGTAMQPKKILFPRICLPSLAPWGSVKPPPPSRPIQPMDQAINGVSLFHLMSLLSLSGCLRGNYHPDQIECPLLSPSGASPTLFLVYNWARKPSRK